MINLLATFMTKSVIGIQPKTLHRLYQANKITIQTMKNQALVKGSYATLNQCLQNVLEKRIQR